MLCSMSQLTDAAIINRNLNELFNRGSFTVPKTDYPLLNVSVSNDAVTVTAEMAGVKKDDVSIKYENGVLSIAGKLKQREYTEETTLLRKERFDGSFEKSLKIPVKINEHAVTASLKEGILTVVLQKSDEVKPRVIEIN